MLCVPRRLFGLFVVLPLLCTTLESTAEAAKSTGKASTASADRPVEDVTVGDPLSTLPKDAQKLARTVLASGFETFRLDGAIGFVRHLDSLSPVDLNAMVGPLAQLEAAYGRPTHFEVVMAQSLSPAGRQFEVRALTYHAMAAIAYRVKLYRTPEGWALTAVEIQSGYVEAFLQLSEMEFDALNKELKSAG